MEPTHTTLPVPPPGRTPRRHGRPRPGQHLTHLVVALATCQQRLANAPRHGSRLQTRRNRQRRRRLRSLAHLQPWPWGGRERFWWGLRWFGAGLAVALVAGR